MVQEPESFSTDTRIANHTTKEDTSRQAMHMMRQYKYETKLALDYIKTSERERTTK